MPGYPQTRGFAPASTCEGEPDENRWKRDPIELDSYPTRVSPAHPLRGNLSHQLLNRLTGVRVTPGRYACPRRSSS